MNLKNHWKAITVLLVVIVVVTSTLIILSQPVTVKNPGPGGDWSTYGNKTFVYYGLMFVFNSSNSTLLSGTVKSNSSGYQVLLLTPGQMFGWTNESNRSLWNSTFVREAFNRSSPGATITIAVNITPTSFLNSVGGSGNLQLSWRLNPDTTYVLLFISGNSANHVLSVNTDLSLYYTYSRI